MLHVDEIIVVRIVCVHEGLNIQGAVDSSNLNVLRLLLDMF